MNLLYSIVCLKHREFINPCYGQFLGPAYRGSTQHKYENDGTSCSEAGDLSQSTSSRSPGVCKHTRDRANTVAESKVIRVDEYDYTTFWFCFSLDMWSIARLYRGCTGIIGVMRLVNTICSSKYLNAMYLLHDLCTVHSRHEYMTHLYLQICSQEVLLAPDVLQMAQMMSEITENIDLCHPLDVNMETVKVHGFPSMEY